jgi:hypothetical protein
MCLLPVWEMGGIHKAICEMQEVQEDEILQQGMSEERMGVP